MTDVLSAAIIVVSLLAAVYALVSTLRDESMDWFHVAGLAVLEALLVAQAVIGFVKIAGDEGPDETALFVGYLLGILLVPAAGAGWGLVERSRWGPGVILVAGLAVAVMTVRLQQIWEGTGA